MEKFVKLLTPKKSLSQNQPQKGQPSHTTGTSLLAQKGTFLTALSGTTSKFDPCVIDARATDHMTGCAHLFSSYKPSPGNLKVKIADGSLATIAGTGIINISPQISLKNVFQVP